MPSHSPAGERTHCVYQYQHIDDLSFILRPSQIDEMVGLAPQVEIEEVFRQHGWEGDGQVGVLWFPPFVSGTSNLLKRREKNTPTRGLAGTCLRPVSK
jgi:hypothetical protein